MLVGTFNKDPDASLDYDIDWSQWLDTGDTISASTWTIPSGITNPAPSSSFTTTASKVWLSGGTAGRDYYITNRMTTAGGRIIEAAILIRVRQER